MIIFDFLIKTNINLKTKIARTSYIFLIIFFAKNSKKKQMKFSYDRILKLLITFQTKTLLMSLNKICLFYATLKNFQY